MSRMTSSSGTSTSTSKQQAQTATATATASGVQDKALTDFSIETIIGGGGSAAPKPAHPRKQSDDKNGQQQHDRARKVYPSYCQNVEHRSTTSDKMVAMMTKMMHQNNKVNHKNPVDSDTHHIQQTIKKCRPKNFQCPACKMAFSNNGQLKNHVRIHTGERPFKCNHVDCNKTFTRNEELTRHKLIHTGVRPHICTSCGKRFGRKDHLKKHVRTHDRKKFRKKVFVPRRMINNQDDHLFAPPKPVRDGQQQMQQMTTQMTPTSLMSNAPNILATTTSNPIINPVTLAPVSLPLRQAATIATSMTTSASTLATSGTNVCTTASTIQQIASDYWQKWYNFIGLYQHQNIYPPVERLSGLFRRT